MLTVLFQLTAERHFSLERKHKTLLFFQLFPLLREIILQLLVFDHDILFLCEVPHLTGDVERIPEVDGEPVRINAVAVKDSTVLLLDVKKIFQVCSTVCPYHAQLIRNFAYVLAVKNRELTRKLEHMSQRTTRDKLLSYLSDQSLKQDSSCFEIPFNRQQLADFLAVDRSAMSKELGKLRNEGILEFNKNHFELKQGGEY